MLRCASIVNRPCILLFAKPAQASGLKIAIPDTVYIADWYASVPASLLEISRACMYMMLMLLVQF
jgi:hypothetical protein